MMYLSAFTPIKIPLCMLHSANSLHHLVDFIFLEVSEIIHTVARHLVFVYPLVNSFVTHSEALYILFISIIN